MLPICEHIVAQAQANAAMLHQEVEDVLLEQLLQSLDVVLGIEGHRMEGPLAVEGTVRREPMQVDVSVDRIAEELRREDKSNRDILPPEAGSIECLRRVGRSPAKTGEHLWVAVEVAAEHLGQHEDELPMVHRLDDLFFDKAAEDLCSLLLTRRAYASSLTTERNKDLVSAGGTLRARETVDRFILRLLWY